MKPETPRFEPYDISCEQSVLGICLVDNRLIDRAAEVLDPEHFFEPLHQRLFEMIVALQTEGSVTPVILHAVMKTDPALAELGGAGYLVTLAQAAPALPNVAELARIIRDLADRRALIQFGEDLIADAYEPPHTRPTGQLAEDAITGLDTIVAGSKLAKTRRAVSAADALDAMLRKIEEQARADKPIGVKTGLDKIDSLLGALFPGKLIFIGGRPGMCKSTVATNIGRNVAENAVPCSFLSGEMDPDETSARIGCEMDYDRALEDNLKPLIYQDFVHLHATGGMIARMAEANLRLRELPFEIVDVSNMTLEWIESWSRRRARHTPGHRVVIIDHLQLVNVEMLRKGANRTEEQTIITKRLKSLAKELGWTFIVLSQLSRGLEERDDKRPRAPDFREGGSIEQDADAIIGLYRPLRYAAEAIKRARNEQQRAEAIVAYDDAKGVLEIAMLKNRSGPEADYFQVFVDEKSSVVRNYNPAGGAPEELLF